MIAGEPDNTRNTMKRLYMTACLAFALCACSLSADADPISDEVNLHEAPASVPAPVARPVIVADRQVHVSVPCGNCHGATGTAAGETRGFDMPLPDPETNPPPPIRLFTKVRFWPSSMEPEQTSLDNACLGFVTKVVDLPTQTVFAGGFFPDGAPVVQVQAYVRFTSPAPGMWMPYD
jgi:hypothetical protein